MSFDQAFERTVGHEGGYINDPADPGGETKFGISKRSYPHLNIAELTREQAREIYRRDFWERGRFSEFPPIVGYQAFDIAVNSGIETAIRMLQRAAGVADDGYIGPVTVAAVRAVPVCDLVMRLTAERLEFWAKLKRWDRFGRGWARRAAVNLRLAAGEEA